MCCWVRAPSFRALAIAIQSATMLVQMGNVKLTATIGTDEEPWRDIRAIVDEAWYIDCDVPMAMQRVYARQVANGAASEVARRRVETNDRPNALHVLSSRQHADVVLPQLPLGKNF